MALSVEPAVEVPTIVVGLPICFFQFTKGCMAFIKASWQMISSSPVSSTGVYLSIEA